MRSRRNHAAVLLCALAAAVGLGGSAAAEAASRPTVLELFTSEGCSSCPPADALLTSLAKRSDLLPLAFHITYWNSLGWRDPYSMEAATSRQALYAARFGGGSYTPMLVVDGRKDVVGNEPDEVAAAIARAQGATAPAVPVMLGKDGDSISIEVGKGAGKGRILLIGFDPRHETRVGRGENRGRTLIESNIVRSMQTVGTYAGAPAHMVVPRGAGVSSAVIVQAPDGRILGAARL